MCTLVFNRYSKYFSQCLLLEQLCSNNRSQMLFLLKDIYKTTQNKVRHLICFHIQIKQVVILFFNIIVLHQQPEDISISYSLIFQNLNPQYLITATYCSNLFFRLSNSIYFFKIQIKSYLMNYTIYFVDVSFTILPIRSLWLILIVSILHTQSCQNIEV